jgi:hypothetical protein
LNIKWHRLAPSHVAEPRQARQAPPITLKNRRHLIFKMTKKFKECDPAHTVSEHGSHIPPDAVGGVRAMEGAMLKAILCNKAMLRVEIDQRAR